MEFKLSDSLIDDIIFAMEDQNKEFLIDAENCCVVDAEFDFEKIEADEESFYSLPAWTSADGYDLLESFTNDLRSPSVRSELRAVLTGGRGVFRNFKDTLAKYPEMLKLWREYKQKFMIQKVLAWYGDLQESWGLERLSIDENDFSQTDELVEDDFVFEEFVPEKHGKIILDQCETIAKECREKYDSELGSMIGDFYSGLSGNTVAENKFGYICRSQSDEPAGSILFTGFAKNIKTSVCFTDFYVPQNYRGLGLGKVLLEKSLALLKDRGVKRILVLNSIPEPMESLLTGFNFEKLGTGYILNLHS